ATVGPACETQAWSRCGSQSDISSLHELGRTGTTATDGSVSPGWSSRHGAASAPRDGQVENGGEVRCDIHLIVDRDRTRRWVPAQAPLQPVNTALEAGLAVKVTISPALAVVLHEPPQLILPPAPP